MAAKRINLSFDLSRDDDLKVYNILLGEKYKTDYVIKAVLRYQEKGELIDKKIIKEAVTEALNEYGGIPTTKHATDGLGRSEGKLPNEVFDMFNNL